MSGGRGRTLADRANAWLARAGVPVDPGQFVCPVCLRRLPLAAATQAHYPAASLPGRHSTALACRDCNSIIGSTYEPDAVDFLTPHMFRITMRLPGTGPLTVRGTVTNDGGRVRMSIDSRGRPGRATSALNALRARSSRPDAIDMELSRPREECLRRAVLAWSYLAWVHYAGYRYAATPGAFAVRRLMVQPGIDLPIGCAISQGDGGIALGSPTETMVVHADRLDGSDDIEEHIGVGVNWGTLTAVLPFANDAGLVAWTRVGAEFEKDRLQHIRQVPLRSLLSTGALEKGLDAAMHVVEDGRSYDITVNLAPSELAALSLGRSPFVITPDRSGWTSRRVVTHEVIAVADAESAWRNVR